MAMSEEARRKLSERMKAYQQKKREVAAATANAKALNEAVPQRDDDGTPLPDPTPQAEPTITQTEYKQLLAQMEELKATLAARPQPSPQAAQVNAQGQIRGVHEKYLVDPSLYPDPSPRLALLPRLARFAFDINYELSFVTNTVQYETKDGLNVKEPKHTLTLIKVVMDEETGEPTQGRFDLRSLVLHEDPQAALIMAHEQGLNPDDFGGQKAFLDEIRFLRCRDWLLEAFYPPRTDTPKKNKKEMVIGGKIVQYYEVSSPDSTTVDFQGLKGKV